ncbi:MAG: heme-binding protein [Pseudorhodoplanes sp.]|nr:heme-binding protein [Pseudorhodoplanes sp.]
MKPTLTQDDVAVMIAACHAKEKEIGREGTIAIVDFSGDLLYLIRPDKQSPNSVEVATRKAQTAAFRERPSSNLEARVKDRPGWLMFPNGLPMSGGVPLFYENECVGGIAVSGIAEDDEVVAMAGAKAFEAAQGRTP